MATTAPTDTLDPFRVRSLTMFAGCSDTVLEAILRRIAVVTADAGEVLFMEGDLSDYAYVIVSGAASVIRRGHELATLGPGDLFGETAMVAGGTRTAAIRLTSAVELLRLDAQTITEITGTQTIAWNMLQSLLERIRRDSGASPAVGLCDETAATMSDGEDLRVAERVVIAPKVGIFRPCGRDVRAVEGEVLAAGQLIGFIDARGEQAEVRSPFAGLFMGMLALEGERVRASQPIAWLKTF